MTEDTIRDGVENILSSTDLILNYLKDLNNKKYEEINKLNLLSNYRQTWNDKFSADVNLNWYNFVNGFELKGENNAEDLSKIYYTNGQVIINP